MMDVHLNDGMLNNVEMKQDRTLQEIFEVMEIEWHLCTIQMKSRIQLQGNPITKLSSNGGISKTDY